MVTAAQPSSSNATCSDASKRRSLFKVLFDLVYIYAYTIYSYVRVCYRFFVSPMMKPLDGEVFLITGSGRGIGKSLALFLASNFPKTTLVLCDSSASDNQQTAQACKKLGAPVHAFDVDTSDKAKVQHVAKQIQQAVGDVTILFNNVGIPHQESFLKVSEEVIQKTVNDNLLSHFWTLKAFLPIMIDNNHGHVVTMASLQGFFGTKDCAAYASSMYGLRGMLESIQDELNGLQESPDRVHFTTVYSAYTEPPAGVASVNHGSLISNICSKLFAGSCMKPEDVAKRVVKAIRRNQDKIYIPWPTEALVVVKNLMPSRLYMEIRRRFCNSNVKKNV